MEEFIVRKIFSSKREREKWRREKRIFVRKFGTKCAACGYNIPPTDVVQRANDFIYHLQCFSCVLCHCQLKTGDEFYLISDQKLLCKLDYDTLKNKGKSPFDHSRMEKIG